MIDIDDIWLVQAFDKSNWSSKSAKYENTPLTKEEINEISLIALTYILYNYFIYFKIKK
jgi:folate-dependent tRNA-U54 methylase TrmFO/GidA